MSKVNIIVVNKQKLIALDALLPVLMEMRERYGDKISIKLIMPDQDNFDDVEKNYHIIKAVEQFSGEIISQPRGNRISLYVWTVTFFISLMFKKNFFFTGGGCLLKHRTFMRLIKKFSSTIECWYNFLTPSPDFIKNLRIHREYMNEKTGEPVHSKPERLMQYDYFISSMPYDAVEDIAPDVIPEDRFIEVGYVRSLPAWERFVEKEAEIWLNKKFSSKKPYCLYILSTFAKRIECYDEPEMLDLFRETVSVLKDSGVHIVFKPHIITDMDLFEKTVKELKLTDYTVDYAHPMILSKNALFVIGNAYSNTMYEAFYQNVPVVEYACYDEELCRRYGGTSSGGRCCDFFIIRDRKKLSETVSAILENKADYPQQKEFKKEIFRSKIENLFKITDEYINGQQ
jgi:hypothetical protein